MGYQKICQLEMPQDMPDRIQNKISEDMSDRMPEDVPVKISINVMDLNREYPCPVFPAGPHVGK